MTTGPTIADNSVVVHLGYLISIAVERQMEVSGNRSPGNCGESTLHTRKERSVGYQVSVNLEKG